MAFTYDISTNRGKVRLSIGDTVDKTDDDESLTDAEVDYALELTSDVAAAAVRAAEFLLGKLRNKIDSSASGITASQSQKVTQLETLLARLEARAARGGMTVYAGGISDSRRQTNQQDTDYPQPSFSVGQDDYPGTGVATGDDDDA